MKVYKTLKRTKIREKRKLKGVKKKKNQQNLERKSSKSLLVI